MVEPEKVEEEAPAIIDPFTRVGEVWTLGSRTDQRALWSEVLDLPDGPGHSTQAMRLDEAMGVLDMCKQCSMNSTQTKIAHGLLDGANERCVAGVTCEDNFADFKAAVLGNSDLRTTMAAIIAEEERISTLNQPVVVGEVKEEVVVKGKKPPAKGKGKEVVVEEVVVEVVVAPPREYQLFSPEMVTQLVDYTTNGLFSHYRLYRATLSTSTFAPRKKLAHEHMVVESVVPDRFSLGNAAEVVVEEEEKEEAMQEAEDSMLSSGAIAALLEQQVAEARLQMASKLQAHEEALEARKKVN